MHTIINPHSRTRRRTKLSSTTTHFRQPSYDCRELPDAIKLMVYVPGVEAAGVEIESNGPDLVVTARKRHYVRVNWTSLHLESAQRDYQLRLRLGLGLDYAGLTADLSEGVLTISVPKRGAATAPLAARRVA
jgi:HSP20 family molecular chaperone IbpA